MLRRRGVKDVYQLKGGIHRYLEEFGDDPGSAFHGLNFVFDQRVAMEPFECKLRSARDNHESHSASQSSSTKDVAQREIIGACFKCGDPYDEYCGSRVCTVCRDLVLVCPKCQSVLLEYHCLRHREWRSFYFTFLNRFDVQELNQQRQDLETTLGDESLKKSKKVRKTLARQIQKIEARIKDLDSGRAVVDRDSPRHCRSCFEPSTVCNGRCWGFWKMTPASVSIASHCVSGDAPP
jgi:ferredoxin